MSDGKRTSSERPEPAKKKPSMSEGEKSKETDEERKERLINNLGAKGKAHRFSKENQPANRGRKPGSTLMKQLKVAEVLNKAGVSPAEEILKLIQSGELPPTVQLNAWLSLLRYCEPSFSPQNVQIVAVQQKSENESQTPTEQLITEAIDVEIEPSK